MPTLHVFCASGGGAKGAFQGGVLEALTEAGIHLDALVGVSTGAIQAGFLSLAPPGLEGQREQVRRLKDHWFGLRGPSSILRRPPFGKIGHLLRILLRRPSLYTLSPFEELLARHVQAPPARPVRLGVVHLESGSFEALVPATAAELRRAVLASSSIPFFFPPVPPDLVDGGVREIAPVAGAFDLARSLLARHPGRWSEVRILVALASPLAPARAGGPDWSRREAFEIALRAVELLEAENYAWDVEGARQLNEFLRHLDAQGCPRPDDLAGKLVAELAVFEPEHAPYSALRFEPRLIREFWAHGFEVAGRRIRELGLAPRA